MSIGEVIAAFIAVLAVWVSLQQLRNQRKHNVLSVKPIPVLNTMNLRQHVRVALQNLGTGPCRITSFSVTDGARTGESMMDLLPKRPDDVMWDRYYHTPAGCVIPAGDEIVILSFTDRWKSPNSAIFIETVRDSLDGLAISFEYTDIYETKFEPKRHLPLSFEPIGGDA